MLKKNLFNVIILKKKKLIIFCFKPTSYILYSIFKPSIVHNKV